MNQLSIIQALTGVIPGEGANANGSQGTPQSNSGNPGAGMFGDLLGQHLSGAALKLQQGQSGLPSGALDANGLPLVDGDQGPPDGASALLQLSAAEAAANAEGADGQVLFGLINNASNTAAIENSPVLAAALTEGGNAGTVAAGPNEQAIPAPFQGLSLGSVEAGDTGGDGSGGAVALLPANADTKAVIASGKERGSSAVPASNGVVEIALAAAPSGEDVSAAAKSLGAAEAPAAPQSVIARSDIAPGEAQKAFKAEGDNQSRTQTAAKVAADGQANIESDADNSGGFARNGDQNANQNGNQGGNAGKKSAAALLQANSAAGPGIKTSLEGDPTAATALPQVQSELPAAGLQSHLTPLRALENSMALQAGLVLPFDNAPIDPATGMQTSLSAQSIATGIQALQAASSISSPASSATNFAHAPNFVAHQVGLQITRAVADGQNEFTIRLNPPEMGRIDVRMEFQADGGVRAALTAEKPETLNLLQRDAAALERTLSEAGIKTDADSLNFSLQKEEAQAGDDGDTNSADKSATAGEEINDGHPPAHEIEITEQALQQMVADGAVDIHV